MAAVPWNKGDVVICYKTRICIYFPKLSSYQNKKVTLEDIITVLHIMQITFFGDKDGGGRVQLNSPIPKVMILPIQFIHKILVTLKGPGSRIEVLRSNQRCSTVHNLYSCQTKHINGNVAKYYPSIKGTIPAFLSSPEENLFFFLSEH